MKTDDLLSTHEADPIRDRARKWLRFLEHEIEFCYLGSVDHTKAHVARVVIYALMLGWAIGLSDDDLDLLGTAAVYHDSRRQNDGRDIGHGQRAADYYRASCTSLGLSFDPTCYDVIRYHDRHDSIGVDAIRHRPDNRENAVLLYQIFKDADALDRFRFGPYDLDERYLRTEAARALVPFVRTAWETHSR